MMGELHPAGEPATLALNVSRADGQAIDHGWVDVQLDAPAPARFFSTDFPLVEGSRLFSLRLPLSNGKTEWRYLFPIRGQYRLNVEAHSADGEKTSAVFDFTVKEKGTKWLFLGGFTLALFVIGVLAGRVFTSRQAVAAALACVFLGPLTAIPASPVQPGGKAQLEVGEATVGRLTPIRWLLSDVPDDRESSATLSLTITHIEKEKTVFAVTRIPVRDEFRMEFHFTDGAEHWLSATAQTQDGRPIDAEEKVTVSAVEPPVEATLPALAFFIAVIALGIGAGRWSKRHGSKYGAVLNSTV